jgi:hypothetical protein
MNEGQYPCARLRAIGLEALGRAPDVEEGILNRVFGQGRVSEHPERQAVRHAAEPVVELGERRLVGARDGAEQRLV